MAKSTKTEPIVPASVQVDTITPNVGVALHIQNDDLVTMGVVAMRNALQAQLRDRVAEIAELEKRRSNLVSEKSVAVSAIDEPDFNAAVESRRMTLQVVFDLVPSDPNLKISQSLARYERTAGREFAATISYTSPDGSESGTFRVGRTYPTPKAILDIEDEIIGLEDRKAAAERKARDLRAQIQDRDGLRDQVSASLTRRLLGHTDGTGRLMLDALLEGVSDAENPILALLDDRAAK